MATIKSRVLAALGQNNASLLDDFSNVEVLFTDALWNIATALPSRLLMSVYSNTMVNPESLTNGQSTITTLDVTDKKVLMVRRVLATHTVDGNGAITTESYMNRVCKEIKYEASFQALDTESIYLATDYSPVYYLEPGSSIMTLKTAPATGSVFTAGDGTNDNDKLPKNHSALMIWTYNRQVFTASGTDGNPNTDWDDVTTLTNIPKEALPVCINAIAVEILNELIANASITDEDSEVTALYSAQHGLLVKEIEMQMAALKAEWEEK